MKHLREAATAAFMLTIVLLAGCQAEPQQHHPKANDAAPPTPVKLVMLQFNDLHGQLLPTGATWRPRKDWKDGQPPLHGGAAMVAGYIKSVRKEFSNPQAQVMLFDCGDWFQGTPEGNFEGGRLVIDFFNRIGVDAAVVGNHDYDHGWRNLVQLLERARFPVLGANIVSPGKKHTAVANYLKPYWIKEIAGVRILFFGLITANAGQVTGGDVGNIEFHETVGTFRNWLPELRQRADQIIILSHCGYSSDRRIAKALGKVKKLRAILGGHSHTALRRLKKEGHIRIFQTGGKGTAINRIEYMVDPETKSLRFSKARLVDLPLDKAIADQKTAQWLANETIALRREWDRSLGRISAELYRSRARRSSTAGNFAADAMRLAAKAKVALTNKGGLRKNIPAGVVTKRDLFELSPFSNQILVLELTGRQLTEVVKKYFEGRHSALEISGIQVTYKGKKVQEITFTDGAAINPAKSYSVAINAYMAGPGDKIKAFGKISGKVNTGISILEAMLKMFKPEETLQVDTKNRYQKI